MTSWAGCLLRWRWISLHSLRTVMVICVEHLVGNDEVESTWVSHTCGTNCSLFPARLSTQLYREFHFIHDYQHNYTENFTLCMTINTIIQRASLYTWLSTQLYRELHFIHDYQHNYTESFTLYMTINTIIQRASLYAWLSTQLVLCIIVLKVMHKAKLSV